MEKSKKKKKKQIQNLPSIRYLSFPECSFTSFLSRFFLSYLPFHSHFHVIFPEDSFSTQPTNSDLSNSFIGLLLLLISRTPKNHHLLLLTFLLSTPPFFLSLLSSSLPSLPPFYLTVHCLYTPIRERFFFQSERFSGNHFFQFSFFFLETN